MAAVSDLDPQVLDAAIERFFRKHGKGWKTLARRQGSHARIMAYMFGLEWLEESQYGCTCCPDPNEWRWRMRAVKVEYRRRRKGHHR